MPLTTARKRPEDGATIEQMLGALIPPNPPIKTLQKNINFSTLFADLLVKADVLTENDTTNYLNSDNSLPTNKSGARIVTPFKTKIFSRVVL